MAVQVHLRTGQIAEHKAATACSWKTLGVGTEGRSDEPRWLICTNEKGDVIASYRESDINGFRPETVKRFSFPSIRQQRSRV
jgi:hypothetical protein